MALDTSKFRGTLNDTDGIGQDHTVDDEASVAAQAAAESEERGTETDAYLIYLQTEHSKYRMLTFVMAILGFALLFLSVGLNTSGVIAFNIYNILMTLAYLFIILTVVFALTRVRPFKKQMKIYKQELEEEAQPDPDEPEREVVDGIIMEKRAMKDMDGFFKIFERKVRTELIPDTDEYRRLRKIWLTVFIVAGVIALAAVVAYALNPSEAIIPSIALIIAFILVIVAFYIDRTRMKPLRNAWARKFRMSEFQMRDNM